jgi:acetyl esterase/lipase
VCVGAVDGFRDEDITYAMRLNQAGVPAELHVFSGAPHGVAMFTESAVARRYNRTLDDWISRQLGAEA